MKSVTEENERKQARTAIGQLFDYEFVEFAEYRSRRRIIKAVAFERRPTDGVISWLKFVGISIFWLNECGAVEAQKEDLDTLDQLAAES